MQEKKQRKEKLNNRLLNLPEEIAFEIFYPLPPESIVQCKLVCKSWCSLLLPRGDDGNYFANMYLHERRHHQQRNLDYSTLNFIAIPEKYIDYSTLNLIAIPEEEEDGIGEFHITEYDQAVEELNCPKVKRLNFSDHFLCIKKHGDTGSKPILVGSCNGLVCVRICVTNQNNYYASSRIPGDPLKYEIGICNPFLHEYVTLPLSHLQFKYNDKVNCMIGFGHNPITDEYKVVRVYRRYNHSATGDVEVYTLGKSSGMWRSKGTINFFGCADLRTLRCRLQDWSQTPVFINGSIHWIAKTWVKEGWHENYEITIVSFNLEDEEFRLIPLPITSNRDNFDCIKYNEIRELRGCLCLIEKSNELNSRGLYILNIWVLKDYMNKGSWVKEFSTECKAEPWSYSPCAIKKKKDGDKFLFWCKYNGFVSYDPRTQNFDEVVGRRQIDSKLMSDPTPVLHINSFVSLKALGEDAEIEKQKHDQGKENEEVLGSLLTI